jgi:hypothetical protein
MNTLPVSHSFSLKDIGLLTLLLLLLLAGVNTSRPTLPEAEPTTT